MSDVDHYDVDHAKEEAERNARYYTDRAIREAVAEVHRSVAELERSLREEIADALINRGTLA